MVAIKEVSGMFWGVTLESGKRYTQTVDRSFHISMAALEPKYDAGSSPTKGTAHVSVMIQHEKADYLLCTLSQARLLQQEVDLNFTEGEEVTFYLNGNGTVHLTGYMMDDMDDEMDSSAMGMSAMGSELISDDDDDDEDTDSEDDTAPELSTTFGDLETTQSTDEEDEDWTAARNRKRKALAKLVKKANLEGESSEDDYETMDATGSTDQSTMNLEDDDSEDEDDSDDEPVTKKAAIGKLAEIGSGKKVAPTKSKNSPSSKTQQTPGSGKKNKDQKVKSPKSEVRTPLAKKAKLEQRTPKSEPTKKATPVVKAQKTPKSEKKEEQSKNGAKSPKSPKTLKTGTKEDSETFVLSKSAKKRLRKKKSLGEKTEESESPKKADTSNAQVLAGGTSIVDLCVGHGPSAQSGKMLSLYYTGRLSNGTTHFDKCDSGKPFKFRLGKNEVIPGWDVGLQGMKVGGKRTVIVPPKQAYGSRPMGKIPANSTLVFEVELKAVS